MIKHLNLLKVFSKERKKDWLKNFNRAVKMKNKMKRLIVKCTETGKGGHYRVLDVETTGCRSRL